MDKQLRLDPLIDRIADHILAHGLAASSLRPLARAAGTSDRMLLYYFADKDAVIAAGLDRIAARMIALLDAAAPPVPLDEGSLRAHLLPLLGDPAVAPFMAVWLDMAARGAQGDAAVRAVGAAIGQAFLRWLERHLDVGKVERSAAAARLLIEIEGTALLAALGMADAIASAHG